ncbi:hypothetical protein DSECCO2_438860 [anaerobic digester metagenome]
MFRKNRIRFKKATKPVFILCKEYIVVIDIQMKTDKVNIKIQFGIEDGSGIDQTARNAGIITVYKPIHFLGTNRSGESQYYRQKI